MPSTRRRRREGKVITTSTRRPRDCSANVERGSGPRRGCSARFEICIFPSGARRCTKLAKTRVVVACVASSSTSSFERQRTAINRRSASKWSVVPASLVALWERAGWSCVVVGRPTQAPRRSRWSLVRFSAGRRPTCLSSVRPSARLAPRERTRRRASLRAPAASIDLSTATNARPRETVFYAARPTSPRRSPASQAASWQTAGIARGSGNVIRKVTQVCHRVVFAAMRT